MNLSPRRIPWKWWRRTTQVVCLLAFLWLFRNTENDGTANLPPTANLLFQLDPLVAASALLAGKQLIATLWPAFITIALTLVLGRVFCGWVCPLGTLLDAAHHAMPKRATPSRRRWRVVKFFVLGFVLTTALLGWQIVGYVDPFSILARGLTVAVDPWLNRAVVAPFAWLYLHAPESITRVSEPVYAFLKAHFLPSQQNAFVFPIVSFAILTVVFGLEFVEGRFWCRNLCPTGALLAVCARLAPLRRLPARVCTRCQAAVDCSVLCRMGAFDEQGRLLPESCNLCLDCVDACPLHIPRFVFRRTKSARVPFEPSRRLFLGSVATGVAVPFVSEVVSSSRHLPPDLIRPPGALPEADFLNLCVRCAACMKVCTTNALQPVLFEAGAEGLFSPRLIARMGYCEYNCTLCAEVCPTGAIRRLPLAEKQRCVMGKAVFDKERCLPFATGESCITCEEHCPLPEKAIRLKETEVTDPVTHARRIVQRPYVVWSLCIGCGICEAKCPIEGAAGIRVLREEAVPDAVKNDPEIMEMPPAIGKGVGRNGVASR